MNKRNAEGYYDPTTYTALYHLEREEKQVQKLKTTLKQICELAGYSLKGQISLVNQKTGRAYKL